VATAARCRSPPQTSLLYGKVSLTLRWERVVLGASSVVDQPATTSTPNQRWRPGPMLHRLRKVTIAALAFPPSLLAYVPVRLLMRFAPQPSAHKLRADTYFVRPGLRNQLSARLVSTVSFVYQRSFLRERAQRRGMHCSYLPSCTEYAVRAVERYGLIQGLMLTGDRLRRCSKDDRHNGGGRGSFVDFP
jgi:putative component of membrane protein insertase Oxa1/YidC/SpoIIIJ protein YidD